MVWPLWKIKGQFFTKLSIVSPYDLAITLLGIYQNEVKTYVHTKTCNQMFVYNNQTLEATKMSFSRLMAKQTVEYPDNENLFNDKKNELSSHVPI